MRRKLSLFSLVKYNTQPEVLDKIEDYQSYTEYVPFSGFTVQAELPALVLLIMSTLNLVGLYFNAVLPFINYLSEESRTSSKILYKLEFELQFE